LHTASRLLADDECKWEQAGCIKVLWMGARYLRGFDNIARQGFY